MLCLAVVLPWILQTYCAVLTPLLLQVYSFPVYDMIQQALWRQGVKLSRVAWRLVRVGYVLMICFVAVLLPFFGEWGGRCPGAAVYNVTPSV
jgi:uncharacterized membrane protein